MVTPDDHLLGQHVEVIEVFSRMTTLTLMESDYDPRMLADLSPRQLRLLISVTMAFVQVLAQTVGEDAVMASIRAVALSAQRGATRP